ncbi:hypothetical protein SOVF_022820 [Spinacia oleracea]|uniref:Protein NDR1-like n=1 Tax=Spinacia oleracea TaxID=3562 RepID=A0A9R0IY74_SPIOL|nr:protein NDR1-like [Spinacia oleracea]KNA23693.1 hypothetical protein SOVF_022820 [Spinacia oleracea]
MAMTDVQRRGCCGACIIPLAGIGVLIWILVSSKLPSFYVDQFSVFSRQENTNSSVHNYTIHYDLRIRNSRNNDNMGIYYDALNITFYYKPIVNGFPVEIGDATFSPFYLRRYRGTNRVGSIETRGVRWENNMTPPAIFRVELLTAVRYRKPLWKGKRHRLMIGADLKVNDQGNLVNRGVKLKSNARRNDKLRFELVGILVIIIFIISC